MAVMTFQEADELMYEFVGGATDVVKGHKATYFDDVALYIGEHTPYKSETSRRHLPCIVIEQVAEIPDRARFYSVTDFVIETTETDETVSDGPIPYQLLFHVHFFSKKKSDHRNLRTSWASRVEPFGTMGDGLNYYEITNKHSMMDESYGDQFVYHDIYELVLHIEVANANTRTYKRVLEAVVSFEDDNDRTILITEETIEVQ